jgi:hypothetical protein
MNFTRKAINASIACLFFVWTAGVSEAQDYKLPDNRMPTLPDQKSTLGSPETLRKPEIEQVPVAAILRATMPVAIRARRIDLAPGVEQELLGLTERLSEVDTEIAQFQRRTGERSFQNLLLHLQALISRSAPARGGGPSREEIERIAALLAERNELNRRIWGINHPGGVMKPGPYVAPARSEDSSASYQVYRSAEPATGSVVAPAPPPCHQESRTHREYRNELEPDGFDAAGTPLYRNVYHPFPVSELVTVCP